MTLSIWRYAHLLLALISSLFLLILSLTGVILAYDAVDESSSSYRSDGLDTVSVAQTIRIIKDLYPEIIELSIDKQSRVYLDALDAESESVKGYIDPRSGMLLGPVAKKSDFIQWTTTLHRSLFLHETGRIVVGVVSFLLLLITLTGILLIVKRQQGWRHFFKKVHRDFFAQYFHVVSGRVMLIPVLMISLTGTYLFLSRTGILNKTEAVQEYDLEERTEEEWIDNQLAPADFPIFQDIMLDEVERIEFPFLEDDPEEYFILTLADRQITVHQLSGELVSETRYAYAAVWEKLSLDLHTGQTNRVWAIVLGLGALNILFFIYSGFVITFRRTGTKIKNKYRADNAEIILLYGSENGSTLAMANRVHKQLLDQGERAFLTNIDQYGIFPNARELVIFTCTYGLGEAPSNAKKFEQRLVDYPQRQQVGFSVLGFGSTSYPDFCAYAHQVDTMLAAQPWAGRTVALHTVNDKSTADVAAWAQAWSKETLLTLATAESIYAAAQPRLQELEVISKTDITGDQDPVFQVVLKPKKRSRITSGDLLAIYPDNDAKERFYSIACIEGNIQLIVKLHPNGLGSGYLHQLQVGEQIAARLLANAHFHLPKKAKHVAMIANGTGIAPFLGMVAANKKKRAIQLYAGFRYKTLSNEGYAAFAHEQIAQQRLAGYQVAYSREENSQYVLDLIRRDSSYFGALLRNGGVIMICGALQMQRDVEAILETILANAGANNLEYYRSKGQLLTDCY
ncbi:PepSY domain-containing protein [Sphingobacterium chungjuense]|uniref:PepSY domain-containing protein n=1 Tax=Sphingobacterium chungjuense TaxID=2675553 RepID=UPI00140B34B3|nr:PepSY domain-containing protein [Sphingobacterium chungjuense]